MTVDGTVLASSVSKLDLSCTADIGPASHVSGGLAEKLWVGSIRAGHAVS
jgi:hypothetical protein